MMIPREEDKMANNPNGKASSKASGNKTKYEELYKKYRPRTWDEVIGQDKIVSNLRENVAGNKIPTAYLFAGPRGCGKTTVALILAKAINCENPNGEGDPCNKCDSCKSIDANTSIGVHYVSAANFESGVVDVKRIVDQARRRSTVKKPIWIIDEIQRLSRPALDALLQPLEDPSMPSTFIFCTTEINSIPQTFTSRTQQRAFKLVPRQQLETLCYRILDKEGYREVSEEERAVIASRHADNDASVDNANNDLVYSKDLVAKAIRDSGATFEGGSVRQTLSELEHLIFTPEADKQDWTRRIEADLFLNGKKSKCGDSVKALIDLSLAIADGIDVRMLSRSLVDFIRELIILGSTPDENLGDAPVKRVEMAREIGPATLLKCFKIMAESQHGAIMDNDARVFLETAIIEMGAVLRLRMKTLGKNQ